MFQALEKQLESPLLGNCCIKCQLPSINRISARMRLCCS